MLTEKIRCSVISRDDIVPAGAKVLPLRSNIPAISEFVFHRVDPAFPNQAKDAGGGIVVGRNDHGQGSSREHAASPCPLRRRRGRYLSSPWSREMVTGKGDADSSHRVPMREQGGRVMCRTRE